MNTEKSKSKNELNQIELMPLPHGGKRKNAGRKPVAAELKKAETVTIRVRKDLLPGIEKLKNGEKSNNLEKENQKGKIQILKKLEEIKILRDEAEAESGNRKDFNQKEFSNIIDMDIKIKILKDMIEEFF